MLKTNEDKHTDSTLAMSPSIATPVFEVSTAATRTEAKVSLVVMVATILGFESMVFALVFMFVIVFVKLADHVLVVLVVVDVSFVLRNRNTNSQWP